MASSIMVESCVSSETAPPCNIARLLEINLISAEDLAPISKSMQTYAVAWINPDQKRTTQTDVHSQRNPEWTEKLTFRLDNARLEDSKLTVEIYTVSWFRDVLVGTVRVSVPEMIAPLLQGTQRNTRVVTLQIRRPSGAPQGKLNVGVSLLHSTMRSMSMNEYPGKNLLMQQRNGDYYGDDDDDDDNNVKELKEKLIHLRRSMTTGSDLNNEKLITPKCISVENRNHGSELSSDFGSQQVLIAGEPATRMTREDTEDDDTAGSILEVMTVEEARAKGYKVAAKERLAKAMNADDDKSDLSVSGGHSRRKSDGGLFSCLAYGIGFTIVCGATKKPNNNRRSGRRRKKSTGETKSP